MPAILGAEPAGEMLQAEFGKMFNRVVIHAGD
jgi:hypothetical protein